MARVQVAGVPPWVSAGELLGPGEWSRDEHGIWSAQLDRSAAADVSARLRGVGLDGTLLEVRIAPPLKRAVVRAARTRDARSRRHSTPGFTRAGVRLDEEGRLSLTPEALALAIGRRAAGKSIVDATAGCGGNAIGFARAGCTVTAIEPDAQRLACAHHNATVYGVADRIEFIPGRAEDVLEHVHGDVLFVDPPWGAQWNRTCTDLPDLPVLAAIMPLADRFEEMWAKVPPSFAVHRQPHTTAQAWFGRAEGDRHRVKFVVVTWTRKRPALA